MQATECFHCGETLAGRPPLWVRLRDSEVAVCCPGCRAAAQLVAELGLEDFYRFRTAPAPKPERSNEDWLAYDEPALVAELTRPDARGRSVMLMIDGLTCAACSWLITQSLQRRDGIVHVSVNTATGRARVVWDDARIKLSNVLRVIAELGYRPQIVTAGATDAFVQAERRSLLKRLAVAGLGMMQVMMFAVAMYAGDAQGMESDIRSLFAARQPAGRHPRHALRRLAVFCECRAGPGQTQHHHGRAREPGSAARLRGQRVQHLAARRARCISTR